MAALIALHVLAAVVWVGGHVLRLSGAASIENSLLRMEFVQKRTAP